MPESQAPGELVVVAGDQVWDLGETGETRHAVCGVTRHPGYRQRVPGTRGYRDKEGKIANQGDTFCTLYSTLS